MNNVIKAVIDVSVKGAGELKSLKSQFMDAEGASAKLGVGMGALKQNVAAAAMAAGAALTTFAVKAVGEFQALALEAGAMSDALGISAEDASRWIEVAGDLGIEASKVESAMLRMEKSIGTTPASFRNLGIEIAKTSDGATDANETFIRTIEHLASIKDPAERASIGTKAFGKSWAELSEIIESGNVREALAAVSDAKVIDDREVQNARAFRDSLDELKGVAEDFTLTVGGKLVPALAEAATETKKFIDTVQSGDFGGITSSMDKLGDMITSQMAPGLGDVRKGFESIVDPGVMLQGVLDVNIEKFGEMADESDKAAASLSEIDPRAEAVGQALQNAKDDLQDFKDRVAETNVEITNFSDAWSDLKDEFSDEKSYNDATDALDEIKAAAIEAYAVGMTGTAEEATEAQKGLRDAILNGKEAVAEYLVEVLKVPPETASEIVTLIDEGELEYVMGLLDALTKERTATVNVRVAGDKGWGGIPLRDVGGPMKAGKPYITHADELVVPAEDKHVFTKAQTAKIMSNSGSGTPVSTSGTYAGMGLAESFDQIRAAIDAQQEAMKMADAFASVKKAATEALEAVADGADDAAEKQERLAKAVLGLKDDVLDFGEEAGAGLGPVLEILAALDAGKFDEAQALLAGMPKGGGEGGSWLQGGAKARGSLSHLAYREGDAMAGTWSQFGASGEVTGFAQPIVINTGADPRAVTEAVNRYARNNGRR